MNPKAKTVEMTLTVRVPETGKVSTFKVVDDKTLILLDNKSNKELLEITLADGKTNVKDIGGVRSSSDVANCIKECSRDCNGSAWCAAKCVAMCSTIIFD